MPQLPSLAQMLEGNGGATRVVFGGPTSQTADRDALARAQDMEVAGAEPAAIWKARGWYRDKDGLWRNEISDHDAKLAFPDMTGVAPNGEIETTLGAILKHDRLWAAYPDLAKLRVKLINGAYVNGEPGNMGGYVGADKDNPTPFMEIPVHASFTDRLRGLLGRPDERLRSVLHETGHALDDIEHADFGPEDPASYDEAASEVRSRNIEKRMRMTPAQRAASYPPSTQDVSLAKMLLSGKRAAAD